MTACASKEDNFEFLPPLKNIQWGMTADTVIKELRLTDNSIMQDNDTSVVLSYNGATLFNQEANITMTFDVQYGFGLQTIYVQFENLNKDDLVQQLNETYGKPAALDEKGIPNQWASKKIADLPQEIQERFKFTKIDLHAVRRTLSDALTGFPDDDSLWDSLQNESLVSVGFNSKDTLIYAGGNLAAYNLYNDDKKYIELIEKMIKELPYSTDQDAD